MLCPALIQDGIQSHFRLVQRKTQVHETSIHKGHGCLTSNYTVVFSPKNKKVNIIVAREEKSEDH